MFCESMHHIPGIINWLYDTSEAFDKIQGFLDVDSANTSFIEA